MSSTACDDQWAADRQAVIDEMARLVEPMEWRGGGHMRYAGHTITWGEYVSRRHEIEDEEAFTVDPWIEGEERIDRIAQSDASGDHYAQAPCGSDSSACLLNPCGLCVEDSSPHSDAMRTHSAAEILRAGLSHMEDRAATYDKPEGERSMAATVEAFKAVTGDGLVSSEERGWLFMVLLKMVRSQQGGLRMDSYEDGAAYCGLMGEAAAKERGD